ncbi:PREDICTED: jerky protein homolog-like [Dufourea novaeangliae]|uniref:jerky protein homolog-like n=1 Tax=Dufourea novaeangliae TaxID=178035 RepID=UPI0007673308|nr:PREDICTED: jerky protein homolog-like [Dufourea novaeangliae]XP_015431916.1 PREDICTED: jerky protein homolog-like [Dufourea novaeangliae]XP_015431917.1 PREDICTED: jerky protein homolog-like [Dufourea novaeangliae]XP_015431918.1 PREDICTED: jerky protein homolog-like [Dufourea novaeangliae]XP_015431919.1 PREDICTED: jerky protein homolog-like [Dufourea novaeangliae]XP_015431920.1 PREDICTED: jerky protein homolog-like [Dufourea novaeangliae]
MSAPSVSKRTSVSVKEKLEIIEKLGQGIPARVLAESHNLHVTSVWRMKRKRKELYRVLEREGVQETEEVKTLKYDELETRLQSWYAQRTLLGGHISNRLLRDKALQINQEIGGDSSFTASIGWLSRFKQRRHIRLINFHREKYGADNNDAKTFIRHLHKTIRDLEVNLNNLYNMDETGLLWKYLPSKIVTLERERRAYEEKMKKDRVTVGFCANATGTHKLPLLFINKDASPRALKHCKNRLPVVFKAQRNAWLNKQIFADWYQNHFKPSVNKYQLETGTNGSVLLVVDHCRSHILPPEIVKDGKFSVLFLPPSTTSVIQPMEQGIIANVKRNFRHRLLQRTLYFPDGVDHFFIDYDLKDCINFIYNAWMSVTPKNIRNSWTKLLQDNSASSTSTETTNTIEQIARTLHGIIEAMPSKNINLDDIEDWLFTCVEMEERIEAIERDVTEEERPTKVTQTTHNISILDEEVKRMLEQVISWSKNELESVQTIALSVKDYYDHK